jgi:hypothetical protein
MMRTLTMLLLIGLSIIGKSQTPSSINSDSAATTIGFPSLDSLKNFINNVEMWCSVAHFDSVGRVYSCNYRGRRHYDDTTVRYTPQQWADMWKKYLKNISGFRPIEIDNKYPWMIQFIDK